jgi:hypothetical protein
MEAATEDNKATKPDEQMFVQWGHSQRWHLRTMDMDAMSDLGRVWNTLQGMRAIIPTIRWAASRVLDATFFPVEWTGAGRVFHGMMPPQEWTNVETRELFGEMDEGAARGRAKSLLNLIKLMELQIELQERDCCQKWYAAGRERFAKLAPDAPALQLATAGAVYLSICLPVDLPASSRHRA